MDEATKDLIKKTASDMLVKMGYQPEAEVIEDESFQEGGIVCNLKIDDPGILIGQQGKNLIYLQHMIRLLVRKKTDEKVKFIVDINLYRKGKNESLVTMAKKLAEQVMREKKSIVLRPMSAYERRIIHMELAENADIETESIGENDSRRIVIKPAGMGIGS